MKALKSRKIYSFLLVLVLAQSGVVWSRTGLASEGEFIPPPPPQDPIVPTNYSEGEFVPPPPPQEPIVPTNYTELN